jgi:catechol 2,3-dioxygenase-like lactoylglutathione lyase family enzyme
MSFAHLTLATRDVERTTAFLVDSFGWGQGEVPGNTPMQARWLNIGRGQQIHVLYTEGFEPSPFEAEFGRHVALFRPLVEFPDLKARIVARGGVLIPAIRTTPFERFFFREPVNGYVFEVIDDVRALRSGDALNE